jgi:membrane-bound serine protease (ClpP class)
MKRQKGHIFLSIFFVGLILTGLSLVISGPVHSDPANKILLLTLDDDTINPITSEYIGSSIDRAEEEGYHLVVLKLDTPGGLLSSTRSIVKRMLASRVPIVVYIAPHGSRAGSAGVFITYASHIAAMAPSTNIGAAHPVNIGGIKDTPGKRGWESLKEKLEDDQTKDEPRSSSEEQSGPDKEKPSDKKPMESDSHPMQTKILQDTVAFIKTLAKSKGRNVEWAVKSVVESESITNDEALEQGVVEYVANDLDELLEKINGQEVPVLDQTYVIDTADSAVEAFPMDARQKFFNVLANPNIAYILMILGFYGLLFEVTHPGFGIPGILGLIFIILAFYSMQTLPTNYAGLALLILGLIFLIAEAYVPGFGLFTFAGLVCLVLGSMILFKSVDPIMRVSKSLIISFSVATVLITLVLLHLSLRTFKAKVISGAQGLVGSVAETRTDFTDKGNGKVFIHGELWDACSTYRIKKGEEVLVKEVNGLKLIIEPMNKKEDA